MTVLSGVEHPGAGGALNVERQTAKVLPGARIVKRTAIANFPREFMPFPPRSFVERSINVVQWTNFREGGHFPALERPTELLGDIKAFARHVRQEIL